MIGFQKSVLKSENLREGARIENKEEIYGKFKRKCKEREQGGKFVRKRKERE